jgi:hypothetical protein
MSGFEQAGKFEWFNVADRPYGQRNGWFNLVRSHLSISRPTCDSLASLTCIICFSPFQSFYIDGNAGQGGGRYVPPAMRGQAGGESGGYDQGSGGGYYQQGKDAFR